MASDKSYVNKILDNCAGVAARAMMGEYLLYFDGVLVGGVYDNRLLVKPTKSAIAILSGAERQIPYPGAKTMLCVGDVGDSELLMRIFMAIAADIKR